MSAQIAVYLRGNELVVVPQGGGGGYYFDVDPVRVVPAEEGPANAAVHAALADSAACTLTKPPHAGGKRRAPVLEAVKARSWKAFYRGVAFCGLYEEEGRLFLERWIPAADGRGFEPGYEEPKPIVPERAGELALMYLRTAPRIS